MILEAGIDLKASLIRSELGEMAGLYETINRVKGMSVLQCRMDFTEVNL